MMFISIVFHTRRNQVITIILSLPLNRNICPALVWPCMQISSSELNLFTNHSKMSVCDLSTCSTSLSFHHADIPAPDNVLGTERRYWVEAPSVLSDML